jgi:hypothetical protein
MEKDSPLLHDRDGGMDIIVGDKWIALNNRGGPGAILNSPGSRYSMSKTYGPREMISLVIPRLGDKIYLQLKDMCSL